MPILRTFRKFSPVCTPITVKKEFIAAYKLGSDGGRGLRLCELGKPGKEKGIRLHSSL